MFGLDFTSFFLNWLGAGEGEEAQQGWVNRLLDSMIVRIDGFFENPFFETVESLENDTSIFPDDYLPTELDGLNINAITQQAMSTYTDKVGTSTYAGNVLFSWFGRESAADNNILSIAQHAVPEYEAAINEYLGFGADGPSTSEQKEHVTALARSLAGLSPDGEKIARTPSGEAYGLAGRLYQTNYGRGEGVSAHPDGIPPLTSAGVSTNAVNFLNSRIAHRDGFNTAVERVTTDIRAVLGTAKTAEADAIIAALEANGSTGLRSLAALRYGATLSGYDLDSAEFGTIVRELELDITDGALNGEVGLTLTGVGETRLVDAAETLHRNGTDGIAGATVTADEMTLNLNGQLPMRLQLSSPGVS